MSACAGESIARSVGYGGWQRDARVLHVWDDDGQGLLDDCCAAAQEQAGAAGVQWV